MISVRNFLCTILLCLCLSPLIHAQALFSRDAEDMQTAAAATGNGTSLTVRGWGGAIIQVTGTFSATVTVEGTVDGTNWVTLRVMNVSDGNFVTSITATGVYAIATAGIETIRARVSAYSSGNVTVKGRGSVAVIARSSGGGSSDITVGTTAISGGTVGRVFFHDTGDVMGEYPVTGTAGSVVLSASPNLTGAPTITSTSNPCLAVGPNGATNPSLSVDCSPASAATGVKVTPAAAGGGVTIAGTGTGNNNITLTPTGTGGVSIPVGAAATPGLFFAGSTLGMYASGGVQMRIVQGASELLRIGTDVLAFNNLRVFSGSGQFTLGTGSDIGLTFLSAGAARLTNGSTGLGKLLIGTSTDSLTGNLTVLDSNAATNSVVDVARLGVNSTGTAATGLGGRLSFSAESSTTNDTLAAAIEWPWIDATHASRTSAIDFRGVYNAGSLATIARLHSAGRFSMISAAQANPTTSDITAIGSSGGFSLYTKGSKLVIAYNLAGVMNFLTIPLDGSTTTFTQTTSAP